MNLDDWLRRAQSRWPTLELGRDALDAFVAGRAIEDERGLDVVLACACGQGHDAAIEVFHREYDRHIRAIAGRLDRSDDFVEEVRQQLSTRLFVPTSDGTRRVSTYSGRGELLAFVRSATSRIALNLLRARGRRRDDQQVDDSAISSEDDPETRYLKRLYRAEFRDAFAAASSALPRDEKLLLRLSIVEGLSIDRIASVIDVHRATAARRIARARQNLVSVTQENMRARLGLDHQELESVLRLVESQLEASVERHLESASE